MKERLNTIYQELLLSRSQPENPFLIQLINALLDHVKDNQILGSIWKASIKTLIKMFQHKEVIQQLKLAKEFDAQQLVQTFLEAKFEHVDSNEEEQKLLLIQKSLLKITKTFNLNEETQFKICKYFMSILKKKAVEQSDQYTLQFSDATKKSLHQLLYFLMGESEKDSLKKMIFNHLFSKIKKSVPALTDKKNQKDLKLKEYICFLIKTLEDCLKKIPQTEELVKTILLLKGEIIEITCIGAECDDVMIRNQAQQLFTFLLLSILDYNIPVREELEILLIKVVLKPALVLAKKLGQQDLLAKSQVSASPKAENQDGSNNNTTGSSSLIESDGENEDLSRKNLFVLLSQPEEILLEMNMNYLIETLLILKPEQLSQLFLMYDCQPFSENFITKSLLMILKYTQNNPQQYFKIFKLFIERFSSFNNLQQLSKNNQGGPQMISYMLEQKAQFRRLAKDMNIKYKLFLQKIDDMYSYLEPNTPAEVASKILVYSREILIDKIAEVIGGKDDRAKRLLGSYLSKMDYQQSDIEQSLRKFLQTYRLAGVDSQVIMRILELFSHKFHEMDKKNTFSSKEEVYEFAYLIIVLQTCQHNPSIKNRTEFSSFIESAIRICPNSKDQFPENFFQNIFNSITKQAFFTPPSRSLIDENFNPSTLNEIDIRLSKIENEYDTCITESEFINSADLTQKQLFHYSNSTEVPSSLLALSGKHLLAFLTNRFLKYVLTLHQEQPEHHNSEITQNKFQILTSLINLNKSFQNQDLVDKLFQVLYKVVIHGSADEAMHIQLENMLWENFEWIKRSLILLPKLSIQSFMKDEIRNSMKDAFIGVNRVITLRQQEKRKQKHSSKKDLKESNKSQSFFDLVYNYFTENADEEQLEKKEETKEFDVLTEIKKKMLMEDKEGDYMENIEEKFDEKTVKQWMKEKSRLSELITLVCSQVRENFNQEEGILCLSFLEHIISKTDHSLEVLEKLWVEMHLLLSYCLKTKPQEINLLGQSQNKEDSKTEYEVISNDTSGDSIDNNHGQQELDLFIKESCLIKTRIFEASSRHLILYLHLSLSKQIINLKQDNQHIVRDVQRIISNIIEDPADKNHDTLKIVDDYFLFKQLAQFISNGNQILPLKQYPKISKFLRLLLILLLKVQTRKIENDEIYIENIQNQLLFFKGISQYLCELSTQLPYDLINLSLDVFQKLQLPTVKGPGVELILESATSILDNLVLALRKQTHINVDNRQEVWFKIIQIMQEKILFAPIFKKYEMAQVQIFNAIKNAVLSHPFEIEQENFKQIRRLFTDILFWQTFENLNIQTKPKTHENPLQKPLNEETKLKQDDGEDSDEGSDDMFESQLEQMCQIGVSNLSDIFIYYIDIIFKEGPNFEEKKIDAANDEQPPALEQDSNQQLFTYLWLNLLKVLLHYAEQANQRDFHSLVICVHDNIKRVIEFLIQQQILVENSPNQDVVKLWKTSWEIIGAFFTEMKSSIIDSPQKEKN